MIATLGAKMILCFLGAFGVAYGIRHAWQATKANATGQALVGRDITYAKELLGSPLKSMKDSSGNEFIVYDSWMWMQGRESKEWIRVKDQDYKIEDIDNYIVISFKHWEDWRKRVTEFYRTPK